MFAAKRKTQKEKPWFGNGWCWAFVPGRFTTAAARLTLRPDKDVRCWSCGCAAVHGILEHVLGILMLRQGSSMFERLAAQHRFADQQRSSFLVKSPFSRFSRNQKLDDHRRW